MTKAIIVLRWGIQLSVAFLFATFLFFLGRTVLSISAHLITYATAHSHSVSVYSSKVSHSLASVGLLRCVSRERLIISSSNNGFGKMQILYTRNNHCTQCVNIVCVVCAEKVNVSDEGYNEESYSVGRCPSGRCTAVVTKEKTPKQAKKASNKTLLSYFGNRSSPKP